MSVSHSIESMFLDTEHFSQDHNNINYEAFIQFILPKWKKVLSSHASMPKGKPYLVIVCSSAIRCVEVIKCLPNIQKLCKIGKMFSKHFKLEEQVELLQKYVYRVIVGTPARLQKLHEETGLFDQVNIILLDMKKDSKERTLLTLPESQRDFFVLFEGIKNHKLVMY
jgi:protein CMS1